MLPILIWLFLKGNVIYALSAFMRLKKQWKENSNYNKEDTKIELQVNEALLF
jgi:hypothetical protein